MSVENEEQTIAEIMCSLSRDPMTVEAVEPVEESEKLSAKRKARKFKRKKRLHEIIPFPLNASQGFYAVPNGDILQTYPPLIFEMLGKGDADQFRNFMLSVCHPDMEMVLEYSGDQNPFGPNNRQFIGVAHCTDYLLASFKSAPDMTFSGLEPVKTKKDEKTGEYFQTWTVLSEMNRVMSVVSTVSTIDTKLMEKKEVENAKKIKRNANEPVPPPTGETTTTNTTGPINTTSFDTQNTNNTTTHAQTPLNIDSLTNKLAAFSLTPIEATRIKKMYNVGQITYNINTDRKITRICNLFCIFEEKPTQKVNGIWC